MFRGFDVPKTYYMHTIDFLITLWQAMFILVTLLIGIVIATIYYLSIVFAAISLSLIYIFSNTIVE